MNKIKALKGSSSIGQRKLPRWVKEALETVSKIQVNTITPEYPSVDYIHFGSTNFDDYDLSGRYIYYAHFDGSFANLMKLNDGGFVDVFVANSYLINTSFQSCYFKNVKLYSCDLSDADFSESELKSCDFRYSNISNARFNDAVFEGSEPLNGAWAWTDRLPIGLPEGVKIFEYDPKMCNRADYERSKKLGFPKVIEISNETN
jgi:uncharacterized protein YjbI with pentapeptide repeats